jgi:hypothetical protein
MAPEVALGEPYGPKVDSYSFGVLFWQIASLTTPYLGYSTKMHSERVIRGGERPKIDNTWPNTWAQLMKDCWSSQVSERPEFDHVVVILNQEVSDLLREEGVVPSRANEIKAKKKKKKTSPDDLRLDVDTRLSTSVDGPGVRKHGTNIV